jgi:hypothetical protein
MKAFLKAYSPFLLLLSILPSYTSQSFRVKRRDGKPMPDFQETNARFWGVSKSDKGWNESNARTCLI